MDTDTDILFVTAFKDLGRDAWTCYPRTNATYFKCFNDVAQNIRHTLVVFMEDAVRDELHRLYAFESKPNIVFMRLEEVTTFYKTRLDIETAIIASDEYRSKVRHDRLVLPEHCKAGYNLINHSKINFVAKARQLFPRYSFYSWIDFGFCNDGDVSRVNMKVDVTALPPRKIIYQLYNNIPLQRISPEAMLREDTIYFIGSSYIIPNDMVVEFESTYERKLIELESRNVVDDDQNVMLQIYYDNLDLFWTFQSYAWFSFYKLLPATAKATAADRSEHIHPMTVARHENGDAIE
jgi:hypothetical protein